MTDATPHLDLPYILPAQAQKHVTHNEAIARLDALTQLAVADRDRTVPPTDATEGARHIVAPGATAQWDGHDGKVALLLNGGWVFLTPRTGWMAYIAAEAALRVFDGAQWAEPPRDLDDLPGLGIATSSDAVNRLAVAAQATLFSHAGAGHQVKVNKSATGDTASLLFQTGWSGRAEMGTIGTDDFTIKLSPDGATWHEALRLNAATGAVSGTAVQQSADDTAPGRLMRADWGYGPGNLLGAVAQAGGMPTGAVIERGSTATGEYLRLADGTQICTHAISLGTITAAGSGTWADPYRTAPGFDWTFPAGFAAPPVIAAQGVPSGDVAGDPLRRVCSPAMDAPDSAALPGIALIRQGAAADADDFTVLLCATGRWA
ncbi:MAG: DUF2793 domain-containing protein [Sediminimonas sp.]|uniref:DUF2793 domain-containing protein n=1 Tax=Sediminimonas sp. TaxID=2823379 RepID=UPI002870AC61|nr:DUF2793 domain-containing protein [Sediminimonas sp.]MDR9484638.1 DUF2793 domain-containing protein [Sediminimonas sp.]